MLRLNDNPKQRFPVGRSLADDEGLWRVAHVKSRQEKKFAKDLINMDVGYYLPMIEKRTRRKDNGKLRKSILPLMPGYVPFAGNNVKRVKIMSTNRVINILEIDNQRRFVCELEQLQSALESGLPVVLWDDIEPGQNVFVKTGPLAGVTGEVVTIKGKTRLIIRISFFKRVVSVEIEGAYIERV